MSHEQMAIDIHAARNLPEPLQTSLEASLDAILATGVQACVICHKAPHRDEETWFTRGLEGGVEQALADFARNPPPMSEACFERGTETQPMIWLGRYHGETGEYLLVLTELVGADGSEMGSLGIAIECRDWDSEGVLGFCTAQARLVVRLLEAWQRHQGMELDLMTESHRAKLFRRKAEIDPLTRLENASAFKLKAQEWLQTATGALALVLIDIDNFKAVNDIYGHQFGDRYLALVAEAIQRTFATNALVGRIGGDEFALLLPHATANLPYIGRMMSLCSAAIQRAAARLDKPDLGRVSMGASHFPAQANNYGRLFDLADAALYASKSSGRATNTIFQADRHERFNNRLFQTRFEAAMARGEVVPFFQPIVCLKTGAWRGFEVLARWRDPKRGLLTPTAFSPVFNDPSMSGHLTREIARQSIRMLSEKCDPGQFLSINLTTFDLMSHDFVFDLQTLLAEAGVDWSSIVIEVTETVMLGETGGPAHRGLAEMRMRGARVALDDFGTGFGGLMHLKDWPIDILKIDRHFVSQLGRDDRDQSIVRAITGIGRDLGLDVVAEGIETEEARGMLTDLGCPYGQGYLFARPFPGEKLHPGPMVELMLSAAT